MVAIIGENTSLIAEPLREWLDQFQPALRIMHWPNRTPITGSGPEWVSLRAGWYNVAGRPSPSNAAQRLPNRSDESGNIISRIQKSTVSLAIPITIAACSR